MWGGPHANVQDVKVFRSVVGDSWGDATRSGRVYSHTLEGIPVMPRTTSDDNNGEGFQGRSVTGKSLFVESTHDVKEGDEFELVDELGRVSRWVTDGAVDIDYANIYSTWMPGIEVQIKRTGGQR